MKDTVVEETIKYLRRRLSQIEETIAILESRSAVLQQRSKRGRKSMGAEERREVSARMKRYWSEHPKRQRKTSG